MLLLLRTCSRGDSLSAPIFTDSSVMTYITDDISGSPLHFFPVLPVYFISRNFGITIISGICKYANVPCIQGLLNVIEERGQTHG
jgi:hypothetical protein